MLVNIQKIISVENGTHFVEFFFTQRYIPVASKEPRIAEDSLDLIGKWVGKQPEIGRWYNIEDGAFSDCFNNK